MYRVDCVHREFREETLNRIQPGPTRRYEVDVVAATPGELGSNRRVLVRGVIVQMRCTSSFAGTFLSTCSRN